MNLIFVFIAVAIVLISVIVRWKASQTDGGIIGAGDLPALIDSLTTSGADGAFFVALIPGTELDDGASANLQFSIEDSQLGMDWVLIAESNQKRKGQFIEFVASEQLELREITSNGVDYLRATGSTDWPMVGRKLLVQMFGSTSIERMQLIVTGFDWKRPRD